MKTSFINPRTGSKSVSGGACARWFRIAVLGAFALSAGTPAIADTLRLPSGEVLIGRILEQSASTIRFESKTLGAISVPAAGVEVQRDAGAPSGAPAVSAVAAAPKATPPAPPARPAQPRSWLRERLNLSDRFSGRIELGADVLNADVRMRNYMAEATFGWKDAKNEYQTHHFYEEMTVQGHKITDAHDEGVRYIRHLSDRWIWLSQADWRHDLSQGIDYRVDVVGIPGFFFVKNDRVRLVGGVGPSYEWRRWDIPGAERSGRFNIAAYEVLNLAITPTTSLRQTFLGYVDPKATDEYRYLFDVSLMHQLGAGLSLIVSYNRRHESNPPPRAVEDRERLTTRLGYDF